MEKENPNNIENIINEAVTKLKSIADVNTVIGSPKTLDDGSIIVPISKVSIGFVAGGGEYGKQDKKYPFTGGSGAGVSISPVGFLNVTAGDAKVVKIDGNGTYDKLLEVGGDVLKRFIKKV